MPSFIFNKESLAQVFFCEFCEISKNTFFYRTPPVAASESIYSDFSAKSCWAVEYNDSVIIHIIDTKYSRMDQIKFVEDSL